MKTPLKAELEARESREKTAARHSAAERIMASFVLKHGVLTATPTEAKLMASASYIYADALLYVREMREKYS